MPGIFVFSLAAISFLAGCGKLRNWYEARKESRIPHSVTIAWSPSNPPVAGYNVYREVQSGAAVKLTVRLVEATQYTDTTVDGGRIYSYYVTSVDFKGQESKPSARITVTVPTTAQSPAK
jgi:fibronectin type 3 domain-containing protein